MTSNFRISSQVTCFIIAAPARQCAVGISHSLGCRHRQPLHQPRLNRRCCFWQRSSEYDCHRQSYSDYAVRKKTTPIAARGQALDDRRSNLLLILPGRHDNTKEAAARTCAQAAPKQPQPLQCSHSSPRAIKRPAVGLPAPETGSNRDGCSGMKRCHCIDQSMQTSSHAKRKQTHQVLAVVVVGMV